MPNADDWPDDPVFFDSAEDARPPEMGGKAAPPPKAWKPGARRSASRRPASGQFRIPLTDDATIPLLEDSQEDALLQPPSLLDSQAGDEDPPSSKPEARGSGRLIQKRSESGRHARPAADPRRAPSERYRKPMQSSASHQALPRVSSGRHSKAAQSQSDRLPRTAAMSGRHPRPSDSDRTPSAEGRTAGERPAHPSDSSARRQQRPTDSSARGRVQPGDSSVRRQSGRQQRPSDSSVRRQSGRQQRPSDSSVRRQSGRQQRPSDSSARRQSGRQARPSDSSARGRVQPGDSPIRRQSGRQQRPSDSSVRRQSGRQQRPSDSSVRRQSGREARPRRSPRRLHGQILPQTLADIFARAGELAGGDATKVGRIGARLLDEVFSRATEAREEEATATGWGDAESSGLPVEVPQLDKLQESLAELMWEWEAPTDGASANPSSSLVIDFAEPIEFSGDVDEIEALLTKTYERYQQQRPAPYPGQGSQQSYPGVAPSAAYPGAPEAGHPTAGQGIESALRGFSYGGSTAWDSGSSPHGAPLPDQPPQQAEAPPAARPGPALPRPASPPPQPLRGHTTPAPGSWVIPGPGEPPVRSTPAKSEGSDYHDPRARLPLIDDEDDFDPDSKPWWSS